MSTLATAADLELQTMVQALPEVYQPIWGHPELSEGASRSCDHRWAVIRRVCGRLAAELGRAPRILDLGCAQGWFSLQLAQTGARVHGYDLVAENVAVCQALARRNPGLVVEFERAAIEELVPRLGAGEYDLVLGLSVFHHICAQRGQEYVRNLLAQLLTAVPHALLEMALNSEKPAWAAALPDDPGALLDAIPFFRVVSRHPTHLGVDRPLYFCSRTHWLLDGLEAFQLWGRLPNGRVFLSARAQAKLVGTGTAGAQELELEAAWLASPPAADVQAHPVILGHGGEQGHCWLV
ncbi:MAG TPA: methyltransferase domain-containing protein, partial [Terriglobales bacterium]|nr:methyltransferase domain-containing protein [Terriglobales bacterium]